MKILVTGSNGFIGRNICQAFMDTGNEVYGLDHIPDCVCDLTEYFCADIASEAEISALACRLGSVDAVVHCAAFISYQDSDSRLMQVNAAGTQNIVTLAKQICTGKLIYLSGVPVIGVPMIHPVTEQHPLAPKSVYHISKLAGEYLVRASGLPFIILRVPSPVGIDMNPRTILPTFISRCIKGEDLIIQGTGTRKQNYIAVQDIAEAAVLSVHSSGSNCYNLSGSLISNHDLALLCKEITHSASRIVFSGQPDPADGQVWDLSSDLIKQELGFIAKTKLEDLIAELQHDFERDE